MLDVLNANYITSARAKGLRERRVLFIHGLKNALIPVLTILGQMTGTMLAGAVVTETVFTYPGIGFTLVKSLSQRDYPVIQAALLFTSVSYLVMNLLIDIVYAYLDPRIRFDQDQ
jgi:ABC-type dipeptide/oligopeptide/nickel transport system permease component